MSGQASTLRAELDRVAGAAALQERQEKQSRQRLQEVEQQLKAQTQVALEQEQARLRLQDENQGLARSLEEGRAEVGEAVQCR